jgi:hypothetical protein
MHLEKTDIIFNTFEDWVNTAQYVLGAQKESLVHQKSHKEVLVFPKAHLGTKPKVAFIPNRKGIKS